MARVALICPDLLFGSRVEAALRSAGHEVTRVGRGADAAGAAALVVDLTVDPEARIEASSGAGGVPRLGFYSHVEQAVRRRAIEAGFERVVPRSRMAREGPALVGALVRDARSD